MYHDYNDAQLFQLAVTARGTARRQSAYLSGLLPGIAEVFNRALSWIKEKTQSPTLVPVYCFEYAPDC